MNGLARPDALVGQYRLADFVGAGGMGEVYRATHVRTGQVVAIKIFSGAAIDARWLARFYHEARVQHGFDHPNIVKLHELIDLHGRPCLVMEYVNGESLGERIRREGRLAPRDALRMLRAIARAVAYVHAREVVHRDLKPANVRVTREGVVKLLDFGISKSRHAEGLTETGNVIGTPGYLAPEQLLGERITHATDVWALGVLLYEMVTGAPPFSGGSVAEQWTRINSLAYAPPSSVVAAGRDDAAVVRRIDRLVASCLVRDPERRPSAEALAAAAADAIADPWNVPTPDSGVPTPGLAERAVAAARHASGLGREAVAMLQRRAAAWTRAASAALLGHPSGRRATRWLDRWWLPITAVSTLAVLVTVALAWRPTPPEPPPQGRKPPAAVRGVHRIDIVSGRAAVFVNGVALGTTPADYVGTTGETVSVELKQPGFQPLREEILMTTTGTSTFMMRRTGEQP